MIKNVCIGQNYELERKLRLGKPQRERKSNSHGGKVGRGSLDGSPRVVVFPLLSYPSRPQRCVQRGAQGA